MPGAALVAPAAARVRKVPPARAQPRALDAARRARRVLQDWPAASQALVVGRRHAARMLLLLL